MTTNITSYFIIGLLILILHRVRNSLRIKNTVTEILRTLTILLEFIVFTTTLFYWRGASITQLTSFDVWATAIDIAFAHIFVTGSIFLLFYYLLSPITTVARYLLLFVVFLVNRILDYTIILLIYRIICLFSESNAQKVAKIVAAPTQLLLETLILFDNKISFFIRTLGSLLITKFLLVDTIDLQKYYLFGDFDWTLGWNLPTTFRFTILFHQAKEMFLVLSSNNVINTTFGFLGFLIGSIIGVAGLIRAVKGIAEIFKK